LSRQEAVECFAERVLFGPNETLLETLIKDDGPGIPAENIDKIFSPFFTTRREGNGLGLAVAAKIVRAHGGEIMAESQEHKGSTFRLLLPVKLVSETREQN
jgi:signal transduction histidine kinase